MCLGKSLRRDPLWFDNRRLHNLSSLIAFWVDAQGSPGCTWVYFAGYVPLASQSPYPITVYSVANYRPHLSHFWANMQFSRSRLSHFLFMYHYILNEEHFTFHPQYKHSGTFANRKYEEFSYPKNQKMCDPILVTLLKMRSHYSQSSRENATPSSVTFPLASYKEVPPRTR